MKCFYCEARAAALSLASPEDKPNRHVSLKGKNWGSIKREQHVF